MIALLASKKTPMPEVVGLACVGTAPEIKISPLAELIAPVALMLIPYEEPLLAADAVPMRVVELTPVVPPVVLTTPPSIEIPCPPTDAPPPVAVIAMVEAGFVAEKLAPQ